MIQWYEWQLEAKRGFTERNFKALLREARENHVSYEEILRTEYEKLKELRQRVN